MDEPQANRRVIAHLDADAFFCSVELMRRPELRGRPVVVCGSGPRAVVTTASYEARRFGVHSAIPGSRARRLCPQAVFIEPDLAAYRRVSREMWTLVRAGLEPEGAVLEVVGMDEAYADLSGVERPLPALRGVVAEVRERTGISLSVGVAPSKLVAKLASDAEKPAGFCVMSREQAVERFAGRPVGVLNGIGPRTAERLAGMGIETLSQLAAAPPAALRAAFGERAGEALHRRAQLICEEPVRSERPIKSQSVEHTFDTDVADPGEWRRELERMSERLSARLKDRGLAGRTVGIKLRLDDFTTLTRDRTLGERTDDAQRIGATARELLAAAAPPSPLRLLGVRVAGFEDPPPPKPPAPERTGQLSLEVR